MKNFLGKLKHAPLDVLVVELGCGTCFSLSASRLSREFFSSLLGDTAESCTP
jgi:hypothetical protein